MYYLKPDQTMVIMYTCKVGDDASTEDLAVNSVSMPFYSYNGGEVSVDDSEIITPGYANSAVSGSYSYVTKQDPNDGSVLLADREQASALSMNVSNNSATQWLVSQVNLSKGSIKPGITKSSVDSSGKTVTQALSTDVLKWAVNVTGGDEGKLHNYTVTDTMMTPYKFTGTATYEIDYKSTTYSYANTGANLNVKFSFDIPEAGTEKTYTQSDGSKCTVRLDVDESTGTQTLTLKFEGSYFDVPPGVNGKLTVQTENINKIYENKDYVNKAYLTPTEEFNSIDVSAGTYTVYDPALDDVENTLPSVTAEARVAVSYGYATTSYITITELDDSTNTGASNSGDNVIALGNTENTFRYVLNVGNSGGVNSPATAMSLFVMVDNLPEVDDHQTFYDDFERYSEFLVQFADSEEDLDLQVYITDSSGNKKVLDSSQYDVLFTELTSFEYADNKDVWQGKDLSDNDDWFTLAECVENGTLSKMRSIRVVLKDPNATSDDSSVEKLMPEKSTISVAFNAKINSDQETGYNEVAYNSFGYLYEVNKSQLQSATASVGVKTPGVPYLSKKLVSATGETFKARQDESFEYIIYRAKNQNLGEGLSGDEIFEKLKELDIDATKVTLDVAKGKSASDVMELSNLKCYVYDENSESWGPGDDYFVWADNESYTIIELPMDDDSDFEFASVNGSQKDVFTFGFVSATPNNITFTNKKESGDIKLTKVSDRTGETLKDALFALYTTNKDEALEEDETLTDIDKAEREIKVDDTTWYLMDLKRSDDSGLIQWSNLMETKYYVLEVEAPESYAIGDEPGQVVEIKFGSTQEITVTNYWSYYLPHTGGNGTMQYTLAGTALTLASAGALLYLKKKKEEQG
jgi:LPXTG-motif cell wall-anchored protein